MSLPQLPPFFRRPLPLPAGVIAVLLLLCSAPLGAATRTWSGAAAVNNWSEPTNWQGGVAPVNGDNLTFSIGIPSDAFDMSNNLANTTFGLLHFEDLGYVVNGSTVRLSGGISTGAGVASNLPVAIFRTNVLLTADQQFIMAFGRFVRFEAPAQIDVGGHTLALLNGRLSLLGNLAGAGSVLVSDTSLELAGSGTFTGPITISNFGSVTLSLPGNLGTTAAPTFIRSSANLSLIGSSATLNEELRLDGGGRIRSLPASSSATYTLAGPVVLAGSGNATFECNPFGSGNLTVETRVTGRISGSGTLLKTGLDPLIFGGTVSNTFTGTVQVDSGVIGLAKPAGVNALASGVGTIVRNAGSVLRLDSNEQIADTNQVLIKQHGTFDLGSQAETIGELLLNTGTVAGTAAALLTVSRIDCFADLDTSFIHATVRITTSPTDLDVDGSQTLSPDDLVFTRALIGNSATLRKTGPGRAKLAGFTGGGLLDVTNGTLVIGATDPSPVALSNGATLAGTGPVGTITAGTGGGRLDPGDGFGVLSSGAVVLNAQSVYAPEIRGAASNSHDVLQVTGTVALNGATLAPVLVPPLSLNFGEAVVILDNDGADPVAGTFAGLAEGAELVAGGATFRLSYVGGTGNDITLTLVDLPITGMTRTWTGLGATTGTGEAQNWNPVGVPQSGDRLVFPSGVPPQRRTVTDSIVGLEFYESIFFAIGGYNFSGDTIALRNGLTSTAVTGTETVVERGILLVRGQAFSQHGSGTLRFQPVSGPIALNGQALQLTVSALGGRLHLGFDGAPITTVTGAGSIQKTGPGTVAAHTPNFYTGVTNILEGTWESFFGNGLGQFGPGNGTVVASGATLALGQTNGPSFEVDEDLTLEGALRVGCGAGNLVRMRGGFITSFADRVIDLPAGTLEISSTIQGAGGLQKEGGGRLRIAGLSANTFTGRVLAHGGRLEMAKPAGVLAVPGDVVAENTEVELSSNDQIGGSVSVTQANLALASFSETLPNLTLRGATVLGSGLLTVDAITAVQSSLSNSTIFAPVRAAGAFLNVVVEEGFHSYQLALLGTVSAVSPTATLVRQGGGVLALTGTTTIANFDLRNGTTSILGNSSASAVALNGGTLSGNGTVASISSGLLGGKVFPSADGSAGILTSGNVALNASTRFFVRLGTNTPGTGHDQLKVNGTVNLNGAVLEAFPVNGFIGPVGTDFLILENDGADPIVGTFSGLPQNGTFSVNGRSFRVSYTGGTGNDVTLRVAQLGTGVVRTWTGSSGADSEWATPANWSGGVAPNPGDDLVFPLLASRRSNHNNYAAGTTFNSIRLEGAAYVLSGNAIVLNDGLIFQLLGGSSSFLLPVTCAQAQAITVLGGQAVVDPATTYANGGSPLTLHVDSASAGLTVRGIAGTGALRKTGPGPVTLSANTHTGANDFQAGEVLLDGVVTGLGAAPSLAVAPGATLRLNAVPATTVSAPLTLGGTIVCTNSPVTFSGAVALEGADAGVLSTTGAGIPIFSGVLSGQSGLRKIGAGEVILSGANPNTFAGGLFVEAGVLRAQKTAGSGVAPGPIVVGDGSATAAELRLINANQIPTITMTLKGAGALFNTNGLAETIGNLSLTGGTVSTGGAILNFSGSLSTFAAATPATINGNLTSTNTGVRAWTIEDGAAADDLIVNGAVNGPGAYILVKTGDGRVNFAGNSNFPKLRLEFGTAAFNGTSAGVAVELGSFGGNQATLTGSGFTGVLTTPTVIGGILAPSGILTTSGNVTLNPETRFLVRLLNPTPGSGHDQLAVLGTPNLGGAQLQLAAQPGFVPQFGQVYRILDNNGSGDAVVGAFANLPEGALVDLAGLATFRLSYVGGDGNDVTLTVTKALGTGLTRTWDGGSGSDSNWTTAANWVGDVAPAPGDALVFPAGAARTSNNNDFPAGTTFDAIQFTGSGYSVSGNQIVLNAGLRAEANIGAVSFGPPLLLSSPQTFFADVGAALTLLPAATLNVNGQALTLQDTVAVGLGAIDLQGVIAGGGSLLKTGSGTIFIRGNNTFFGSIDIQQGGLQIFHVNALGTTDVGTSIRPGAFLQLNSGGLNVAEPLSLAGTVLSTTGNNSLTGPLTLPGPLAGTVNCVSPLTISGVVSGPGGLQKNGLADLTFAGLGANTFTGGFILHEMNAFLQKTPGVVALPGPVVVGDGLPPNELRLLNPNQIADSAIVTSTKGTFNLNSLAETIGGLVLTEATVQTGSATLALTAGLQCLAAPNASTLNGQILLSGAGGSVSTWSVEDGDAADDLQVSAIVSSNNPALEKTGPGRARFSADNTLGLLHARDGHAIFTGASDLTSVVLEGGTLGGTGRVADAVSGSAGGTVAPGLSPGQLTLQGRATWNANTTFAVELNGTAPGSGYDRLNVAGEISLGGAKLAVSVGFTPAVGATFTILRNTGGLPVTGTFAGLPEGGFLSVPGGFIFQITYLSSGNNITLTRVAGVTPVITSLTVVPGVGAELGLNVITVSAAGTPGVPYQLETSPDLQTWTTSIEQQAHVSSGVLQYRFTQSPGILKSFQRVRLP